MKKYIIWLLVVLCTFTACRVDSGTTPQHNEGNNMLWNEVELYINQMRRSVNYAICAECFLQGEEDKLAFMCRKFFQDDMVVTADGQRIYFGSKNDSYRDYFDTDGKSLAEGGVWQLRREYRGNDVDTDCYVTVTGSATIAGRFEVTQSSRDEHTLYQDIGSSKSVVDFEVLPQSSICNAKITTQGSIRGERDDFNIEYRSAPETYMQYENAVLRKGTVDIIYTDNYNADYSRTLRVLIDNNYVTYQQIHE